MLFRQNQYQFNVALSLASLIPTQVTGNSFKTKITK